MEEDLYQRCKRIFEKMYIYGVPLIIPDEDKPGVYTINIRRSNYIPTREEGGLLEKFAQNPSEEVIQAFRKLFNPAKTKIN